jgi:hypothetical protein
MSTRGYLRGIPGLLRRIADRLDPDNAPRALSGSAFTFETTGMRLRSDGRGCPLWYIGEDDYQRAHTEADTRHVRIDWQHGTADWVGGDGPDHCPACRHPWTKHTAEPKPNSMTGWVGCEGCFCNQTPPPAVIEPAPHRPLSYDIARKAAGPYQCDEPTADCTCPTCLD